MRASIALATLAFILGGPGAPDAATISGNVKGPDGKPFRAAFVQGRNAQLRMNVSVLTDNEGNYRAESLPAGEYRVSIRAIGYRADARSGLELAADGAVSQDFALQAATVRWSDLTQLQGLQLLPDLPGKQELFGTCMGCHGFQSKMAAVSRDEDGWRDRVAFMRESMRASLGDRRGFDDAKAEIVTQYLTKLFSEDSILPKSPSLSPNYAATVETFSDEALEIVYVDYEMPGPNRFPWTAQPDRDGRFWTPEYGRANKISRLDAATGEFTEFPAPHLGTAMIHSAVPAPDGSVWLTEAGSKKLGHWEPSTGVITEYQDTWGKHTVKIHPDGRVFSSGGLSVFDPKTKEFTHIAEVPSAYGLDLDSAKNVWFTENIRDGKIGKVDAATLKVTKYAPPTNDRPRRITIDRNDMVWFGEFESGKIGRFDPKSGTFREFPLPNPKTLPYALKVAPDGAIWYSSEYRDLIGRLDPETGKVVEYPLPYTDNGLRDFFLDKEGRMWFGTPPNNKIGYFYIAGKQRRAEAR